MSEPVHVSVAVQEFLGTRAAGTLALQADRLLRNAERPHIRLTVARFLAKDAQAVLELGAHNSGNEQLFNAATDVARILFVCAAQCLQREHGTPQLIESFRMYARLFEGK